LLPDTGGEGDLVPWMTDGEEELLTPPASTLAQGALLCDQKPFPNDQTVGVNEFVREMSRRIPLNTYALIGLTTHVFKQARFNIIRFADVDPVLTVKDSVNT
jgi:hypothetical protein